jgi:hypothetical protein
MIGNRSPAPVTVTRKAIHDLMNHLCVAMGNSELLLMDLTADDPRHAAATEIRDACTSAMAVVQAWSAPEGSPR